MDRNVLKEGGKELWEEETEWFQFHSFYDFCDFNFAVFPW